MPVSGRQGIGNGNVVFRDVKLLWDHSDQWRYGQVCLRPDLANSALLQPLFQYKNQMSPQSRELPGCQSESGTQPNMYFTVSSGFTSTAHTLAGDALIRILLDRVNGAFILSVFSLLQY